MSDPPAPRVWVVNPTQPGDFLTIGSAIAAAHPGDTIRVRPGRYDEHLLLDKPLTLEGDGPCAEIIILSTKQDVITFQAETGRLRNLTLRKRNKHPQRAALSISAGRLEVEDCDISSAGGDGILIHERADPVLRRNYIHSSKLSGVRIYGGGQGLLEDNKIAANTGGGVIIVTGGAPTLRRNWISENKSDGVAIYQAGAGLLENNVIRANIHAGVFVMTEGYPTLRHNQISANGREAIWVVQGGGGRFEYNDLRGNACGAWHIKPDCLPNVKRINNLE